MMECDVSPDCPAAPEQEQDPLSVDCTVSLESEATVGAISLSTPSGKEKGEINKKQFFCWERSGP